MLSFFVTVCLQEVSWWKALELGHAGMEICSHSVLGSEGETRDNTVRKDEYKHRILYGVLLFNFQLCYKQS